MYVLKSLALVAATAALLGAGAPITGTPAAPAPPQISIGVNLGAAPVCPYGYFDYAPYDCAPYGYLRPGLVQRWHLRRRRPLVPWPPRLLRTRR